MTSARKIIMELSETLPHAAIAAKIGEYEERVGFTDADSFIRNDKESMSSVGLYVWDQMVARHVVQNPRALATVYPNRLDKMAQFIKRELRQEWITDAFTTKLFSPILPDYSFVDLEIVQCYPGDIHLLDLEFSDVRRPLDKPSMGVGARGYHGLGVFGDFLDNVKQLARERGLHRISLMAASPEAHQVFSRHGFVVGDGALAQWTFDNVGHSHAMLLTL
jgi:hypothetical protein